MTGVIQINCVAVIGVVLCAISVVKLTLNIRGITL